ncbi:DUF3726 domain-containing protein [Pseudohalocynthiibacter aestuariivivens]|nr:DUF3726 domain-containing protein [Pseudohalocynthiibacter aestuariivivens]QIE45162.1 DUF3726 domain-containing protein [Pseudohalocynthiibacter aestuariivivens]
MSWSLSEAESLSRKAARGAGFSWGMAEEAGRAVRWLASVSLPGPEMLVARLERGPCAAPEPNGEIWTAISGPLCPIGAGVALADRAATVACGPALVLRGVANPMLLVPFVAAAAAQTGTALRMDCAGGSFIFGEHACGKMPPHAHPVDVRISTGADPDKGLPRLICQQRYQMPRSTEAVLLAYAHRTYAPDTEASRLSGAGAGLSDSD